MRTTQRFRRAASIPALTLCLIAFAGCNQSATKQGRDATTTLVVSSGPDLSLQVPSDWPAEVPVVGGEIAVSTSSGTGSQKTWVLEFYSDDLESTWTDAHGQLSSAGFTETSKTSAADGTIDAVFSGRGYLVMVKVYTEADTDEDEIRYVVSHQA